MPILRGGVWSAGGHVASVATSLIALPIVIRLLGTEQYGVYSLIAAVTGYLGFADFGMGVASTKFASEAHAREGEAAEAAAIWTAALVSIVATAMAALAIYLLAPRLAHLLLPRNPAMQSSAAVALALSGFILIATGQSGVFNTPQLVRLRYDVNTKLSSAANIATACALIAVLWKWPTVTAAVACLCFATLATAVCQFLISRRFLPALNRPRLLHGILRPMIGFGGAIVAAALAGTVTEYGERFFTVRQIGAAALAYYAVAYTMTRMLGVLPNVATQSLLPAFSRLLAKADLAQAQTIYDRANRGIMLLCIPCFFLLCTLARPALRIWLGPEFSAHSSTAVYILSAGWIFRALSCSPRNLLSAAGKANWLATYAAIEAGPYVGLLLFLVNRFGMPGAAMAWSARVIVETCVLFILAGKPTSVRGRAFSGKPLVYVALLNTMMVFFAVVLIWSRVRLPILAAASIIAVIVYAAGAIQLTLPDAEKHATLGILRRRLTLGKSA